MRFILISDSHGNKKGIDKIFKTIKFDYLFFMGDGLSDLDNYVYLDNVISVSGNCDFFSRENNEKIITIGNDIIFVTHGNKYGVKSGLEKLKTRIDEIKPKFAFFGHTHSKHIEEYNGCTIINPGSFSKFFDDNARGVVLEINDNDVKICDLVINC
ncbi:MAG: YfcE family phosphodiesterase [Clostridia bacterium]|nr:YfcE family phosphodiesterase [Clostridia bacterium]